ncbi:MAG TPA: response regulator [Pyrinomonadaceae bacterium]|jgi:two-component system, cell cycle response regulator DivK
MSVDNQRVATVMVVDNDEDDLCLLRSVLQLKGFDVLEAENGKEAVDLATRWRPDLILMDLKLPIINGFTAIRHIRQVSNLRETPIIAFSLPVPTSHNDLALAAGCVAHLEKPIDFDQLDILIEQYLPGRRWELISSLLH